MINTRWLLSIILLPCLAFVDSSLKAHDDPVEGFAIISGKETAVSGKIAQQKMANLISDSDYMPSDGYFSIRVEKMINPHQGHFYKTFQAAFSLGISRTAPTPLSAEEIKFIFGLGSGEDSRVYLFDSSRYSKLPSSLNDLILHSAYIPYSTSSTWSISPLIFSQPDTVDASMMDRGLATLKTANSQIPTPYTAAISAGIGWFGTARSLIDPLLGLDQSSYFIKTPKSLSVDENDKDNVAQNASSGTMDTHRLRPMGLLFYDKDIADDILTYPVHHYHLPEDTQSIDPDLFSYNGHNLRYHGENVPTDVGSYVLFAIDYHTTEILDGDTTKFHANGPSYLLRYTPAEVDPTNATNTHSNTEAAYARALNYRDDIVAQLADEVHNTADGITTRLQTAATDYNHMLDEIKIIPLISEADRSKLQGYCQKEAFKSIMTLFVKPEHYKSFFAVRKDVALGVATSKLIADATVDFNKDTKPDYLVVLQRRYPHCGEWLNALSDDSHTPSL